MHFSLRKILLMVLVCHQGLPVPDHSGIGTEVKTLRSDLMIAIPAEPVKP